MSFKDRLKEARLAKGLKQTELSIKIGMSKNAVSNYEAGSSFPNVDTLYKIFQVLDVDPNFLFQDDVSFHNITLSVYEKIMLDKYRSLNPLGQQKTDAYVDDLLINPKYRKEPNAVVQSSPPREIAAYGADGTKGTFTKKPKEIT